MEKNLFEIATRRKFRFKTSKGQISVEDLWDLSLESLNSIAKSMNKLVKELDEEDFLESASRKSKADEDLINGFELVKYIIKVKLTERQSKLEAAAKEEKKRVLREAIERAEAKDLESKSAEELKKMLEELE